ncbi:MAG: fibronectin type III domain-containing protein [Chloroflexota bacterium]|nr:fibronectin type III domain-containing protein [Chloroflexota bacterium]
MLASFSLFAPSPQAQSAPPAPTGLSASAITNDSITITWTKSAGATSYEIRTNRDPGNFGEWLDVGDVATYIFTGLIADRAYAMNLRAKNANGVSSHVLVRANTLDGPNKLPPPPTNVQVSRVTHNSITITWTKSPGATSYEGVRNLILVSSAGEGSWHNFGDVDSITYTCLLPNSAYKVFLIRAKNAYGTSLQIAVTTALNLPTLPAPPGYVGCADDDDDDDEEFVPYVPPKPTPIPDTLNYLPPGILVNNWVDGAQGRQVDHIGVGRADLIEQGILDAVDLWSYITPGIEVCFNQPGRVVFLDAAYAPRQLFDLPAYQRDGMTCAEIDRAGTVVLLRGDPPPVVPPEPSPPEPSPPEPSPPKPSQTQFLSGCEVRPWADVKFRESPPGGTVIGVTGLRKWLPASEKRYGYFKVRLWATDGWISGDYVYTRGNCGR